MKRLMMLMAAVLWTAAAHVSVSATGECFMHPEQEYENGTDRDDVDGLIGCCEEGWFSWSWNPNATTDDCDQDPWCFNKREVFTFSGGPAFDVCQPCDEPTHGCQTKAGVLRQEQSITGDCPLTNGCQYGSWSPLLGSPSNELKTWMNCP